MKILRAKVLGYCMGVRRACEAVESALKQNNAVYTLGPLIHNNSALKDFETRGVRILNTSDISCSQKNAIVIIRAHGVPPLIKKQLEKESYTVVDATCPRVISSQQIAEKYSKMGYTVIIAGDKNHGEVEGIAGCVEGEAIIVENAVDAAQTQLNSGNTILLAQTTITEFEYAEISNVLKQKNPDIKVFNTICTATATRQEALLDLCSLVDGILVIGGKNSANTSRLYKTASEHCSTVALIEDASEIPSVFFTLDRVGLSAGASTPDSVIAQVEQILYNSTKL